MNPNSSADANDEVRRVKLLYVRRKELVMYQVKDILEDRIYANNKLQHLNYEQLDILKLVSSEPSLHTLRPYRFAGDITSTV